ncbi:MAG: tRNA pseudouridine(55) synthase TruB [Anaerolineae bacterium]|nr:tRNA pseudouridine(55) synthase TruB [Anaerolineae bacterium]
MFGLLNIDKPEGPTSHDIVAWVRRLTRVKKVGHAGTLDPLATGVLVLCLGQATRLSEYAMGSRKTYRARAHFGVETDTLDASGNVIAENFYPVSREAVEQALDGFRGDIEQVPPIYSALKRDGRRLYDLARAGQHIELESRPITIFALDLVAWDFPYVTLDVTCSPGTYIRSLARDLGQVAGVGAHLAALQRTASGAFTVDEAVQWPDFEAAVEAGTWRDLLLPPDLALADLPAVHLNPDQTEDVRHGRSVRLGDSFEPVHDLARAYDPGGRFFAVLERRDERWKPHKVFG